VALGIVTMQMQFATGYVTPLPGVPVGNKFTMTKFLRIEEYP
jgi:hypothetical protein